MDKLAFSEMLGREIALHLFLESEVDGVEKTASAGGEVDEDYLASIESALDEVAYREGQQKIAHNNGAYSVLANMAEALESDDFDPNALLGEIKTAMVAIEESAVVPHSEEEDQGMYGALVKGASDMLSNLTESDLDDNLVEVATAAVNDYLGLGDE